jgi:hypothetical protein
MKLLAARNGFSLIAVLQPNGNLVAYDHPLPPVLANGWKGMKENLRRKAGLEEIKEEKKVFNDLNDSLLHTGVRCINLWQPLRKVITPETSNKYIWPIDGHCNGQGYELYTGTILTETSKLYPGFWDKCRKQVPGN